MEKVRTSEHLISDRMERVVFIATTIGFGEIIDEFYVEDAKHGNHYECITSTGVLIVKAIDKETIITMYIARLNQVLRLYHSKGAVPIHLVNTIKRNEKQRLMEKSEKKVTR